MKRRQGAPLAAGRIVGAARLDGPRQVSGHVYAQDLPARRWIVELFVDDVSVALGRADRFDDGLARTPGLDPDHGFTLTLREGVIETGGAIEVRLANDGRLVGETLRWQPSARVATTNAPSVEWLGGLGFRGSVAATPGEARAPVVTIRVEGEAVAEVSARGWAARFVPHAEAARSFDVVLPERFADGRVRHVEFEVSAGAARYRTSLTFVASPGDGRARSWPMSGFAEWRRRFPEPDVQPTPRAAMAVALVGEAGVDVSLGSLDAAGATDWTAASLPSSGGFGRFVPADLRRYLRGEARACPYLAIALSGTRFETGALDALAAGLVQFPEAPFAYGDLMVEGDAGDPWPIALPAWSPERQIERGDCAFFFVTTPERALEALKRGVDSIFALALALTDPSGLAAPPVHVPRFSATLPPFDAAAASVTLADAARERMKTKGVAISIEPRRAGFFPAVIVRRARLEEPLSTVIALPARAEAREALARSLCAEPSVLHGEAILVGPADRLPDSVAAFGRAGVTVRAVAVDAGSTAPESLNAAAAVARCPIMLLVSTELRACAHGWTAALMDRMAEELVDVAAPVLLAPDGRIAAAGYLLNPETGAEFVGRGWDAMDLGPADALAAAHEVSAAPGLCLMVRRKRFVALGGFDVPSFRRGLWDVDLCLRIRSAGGRILVVPEARVIVGQEVSALERELDRNDRGLQRLRATWRETLLDDPFYNPALSLEGAPWTALASPPRPRDPRVARRPIRQTIPKGV